MAEGCCTPSGNIMILACSGGSNVGQLANLAAVELTHTFNLKEEDVQKVKEAIKKACGGEQAAISKANDGSNSCCG